MTGSPIAGQQLSGSNGTWSGTAPFTYAYQWQRCDPGGAGCVDVAGATRSTYLLGAADVGSTLRFKVTASNTAGSASAVSAATEVVSAAAIPPANVVLPAIAGTAQQGQQLTGSQGVWSGTAPLTYAYQWQRCDPSGAGCVDVAGATRSTYLVAAADVGSTLRFQVTASNVAGSASAQSAQTAVVAGVLTVSIGAGGDDGNVMVRSGSYPPSGPVTVDTSSTTRDGGAALHVRALPSAAWAAAIRTSALPDSATVRSATLKLFVEGRGSPDARQLVAEWYSSVEMADQCSRLLARLGRRCLSGVAINSLSPGAVTGLSLQNLASVSTTGYTGLRLHVDGGAPTGDNYVQFGSFENGSRPEAAAGHRLRRDAGSSREHSIADCVGLGAAGQQLSGSNGTWSGTAPITYAYQWQRCDTSGAGCVDVAGATGSTYLLAAADVGSTMRFKVPASNGRTATASRRRRTW